MSCRRPVALIAGLCLAATSAVGTVANAAAEESVTITAEFVVYERPYGNDTNIGPFDHHALFHPGGVGPAGQVCSPDRVGFTTNEIFLTLDPAGGSVTGRGVLEMTCEYHPGCGAVSRTQGFVFRGVYDPVGKVIIGEVDAESSGGETTAWGDGPDGPNMCLESTWTQESLAFTTNWLLNLDVNMGFMALRLCDGDPHQRTGWFTVTHGDGLVGAPIDRIAEADMARPSCAAAVDTGDPAEDGGDAAAAAADEAISEAMVEPADQDADESQPNAEADGNPTASQSRDDEQPGGKRWPATVWLILFLGLVAGAVGVAIALKGALLLGGRGPSPLLTTPKELVHAIEKEWDEGVTDPHPSFVEYQDESRDPFVGTVPIPVPPPVSTPAPPTSATLATAPSDPPVSTPSPAPAAFAPTHQVVLGDVTEHAMVPGRRVGSTQVTLLGAGEQVEVLSDDGERVIVRCGDGPPMYIDRSNLRRIDLSE